ncbi:hypothetical protein SAMN02745229_03013 [Butyrivibrio fibrisolvens DSM 3071]|uniref:ABC-2 family transporter protein n=1 Tax=Butyrivibrio fibrisolvens DSM 3071 TaxID=1121131 RepID=A0A1M6ARW1_BUTFI|nr:hypothetical protein [Butyrivibrio fibrisolvens]SHI39157.1 hypothetical protein SAMN02745229_03013 [Butyrivibrio fibrisolvens DSM 3071]
MKDILKVYRIFCNSIYSIVVLVLFPVLAIGIHTMLTGRLAEWSLFIIAFYMMVLGVFGDFFCYNGINSKDFQFGLFRNTLNGRNNIKLAIVTDQVRRFLQICFVLLICGAITLISKSALNKSEIVLLILILIAFVYGANSIIISILRFITEYTIYMGTAFILVALFGAAVSVLILYRYEYMTINLWTWLIVFIVLDVIGSFLAVKMPLRNFDRSFKEREV